MRVGAILSTTKARWIAAALLWLAFVGLVFWHDSSKHRIAAKDSLLVDQSVHRFARSLGTDEDKVRHITFPDVSHSEHYDCVTLQAYRTDGHSSGRYCYRRADGRLVEERISFPDFRGPSVSERIADAILGE